MCEESGKSMAAVIIIGDEILKGQTLDTNSNILCKKLSDAGIKVAKVAVIGDDLQEIAQQVSIFSSKYDIVFTSGGVGPTHDDVTYDGVAQAFGDTLKTNPEIVKMIKQWYAAEEWNAAMKMAIVPKTAKVFQALSGRNGFPFIEVNNVYILPGVPEYFTRSVTSWFEYWDMKAVGHVNMANRWSKTSEDTLLAAPS